ncbi:hypothetical protein [Bradyrhizobium sp. Leo121]|uniref:hypothetical protein n=1 Tax=Bradyrhizobium sp. Leo121 TaxID=1571195 RepID=UPI00102A3BFE|nr:hypothetical protein [Bradyrhizobium sp. Leo121]RZN31434.1 hypothetical protein CWO90_16890 [Bradyrhizobium sp. Leo121]
MRCSPRVTAAILLSFAGLSSASAADTPAKAEPFKAVPDNPFFSVNDNRLTFAYIFDGTDPGVPGKTAKQVYAFTHFDVWAYGTNFFNIAMYKSDHNDPAVGGTAGATEFFGSLRSTIGFNQVFDTTAFTVGPLRNVSFEFGGDVETENNVVAPAKRAGVLGVQFAFDLPYKGYINVAPLYYKEINHNAFFSCAVIGRPPCLLDGNTEFRGTWALELNYYMDLGFLPEYLPLSVSGRANFVGPKGNQASPINISIPTVVEINSEPIRLTLDASKVFWGPKYSHFVDVWVAYRYWQNKFGLDHLNNPTCTKLRSGSCTESSLYSGISVKF